MRPKVVVTDQTFGNVDHEKTTAHRFGASFDSYDCGTEAQTRKAVAGASVVFVNFAPITRHVLEVLAPDALVIRYGIGYDNVDIDAASSLGVTVCNVPDYGADTVADHTVASLLALLRKIKLLDSRVRSDGWLHANSLGPLPGFAESTVGLIGTGRIGRAVASRLRPFGFKLIAHDPFVDSNVLTASGITPVELDQLFEASDAISLHLPLTDVNHRLVDEASLAKMRPGAVLVNTSRGGLVDQEALADALAGSRLGGAALDVFDPEPLAPESRLRDFDNVILTPHAAFFSDESVTNLQCLAAEEAARRLAGQRLRCPIN